MNDEPAPSLVYRYKEFDIHPVPYQLADTGEWKVHINILRHTEEKTHIRPFTAGGSCPSKEDAIQLCYDFGKKIIDGKVPDCSVEGMGKYQKSSFWGYSLSYGSIALLFGLLSSIFAFLSKEKAQQTELNHLAAQRLAVVEEVARRQDRLIREFNLEDLPEDLRIRILDQFQATAVTAAVTSDTAVTKEAIVSLLDKQVGDLSDRIKQIEDRFPSDATIEKVASVNDAILGTRLESIEELVKATRSEMNTLRGDMLNKWDVAVVVIMLLGAIATLTALVIGAIEYIKRQKASSNAS